MAIENGTSGDEKLRYEANLLQQEARIILPGTQTLFGFQLVAVFHVAFREMLSQFEQILHVSAIGLTICAMAFAMAPAAYNRQEPTDTVSERFIRFGNFCLRCTLFPLALSLSIEFALVTRLVIDLAWVSITMGAISLSALVFLWYVYPAWVHRKTRR